MTTTLIDYWTTGYFPLGYWTLGYWPATAAASTPFLYHLDHQQDWRLQQQAVRYPFSDHAPMLNSIGDVIPDNIFIDAIFHPIGGDGTLFLSSVVVDASTIRLNFSDQTTTNLCYGSYAKATAPTEIQIYDLYDRVAGRIVVNPDAIGSLTAWGLGTHIFAENVAPISPNAQMPMPEVGLRGIVMSDGEIFSGPVTLVGEDGVYFRTRTDLATGYDIISVDILGDPLFLRKGCDEEEAELNDGPFLETINGRGPDDAGNFTLFPGDDLVYDSVVRIIPIANGLRIKLVGSKVDV